MSKKEPLFELIDTMTMSEKRFFKIFSQRHVIGNTNQYLELFNYIDKYDVTSNDDLKGLEFVRNLSAEKNYLYRLILKSLNSYYYEFSHKMKVQNLISNAEILAYKGLEEQALKLLKKAEVTSIKAELYSYLITIKQTRFEILSKQNKYVEANISLSELNNYSNQYTELLNIQTTTTKIYELRQQQGGLRSNKDLLKLENIVLKKVKNNPLSKKAELFKTSMKISIAHAKKDYKKEISLLKVILKLYEENEFLIELSAKGYISSMYNLANSYRNIKDYSLCLKTITELDHIKSHKIISASKNLSAHLFYLKNNLRLYIHIIKKEFDQALKLHDAIKKDYSIYSKNTGKSIVYEHFMLLILIHFEMGNYKKALFYSNEIINDTTFKVREDMSTYIRLFNLIIHFELKNDFTMEYLSSSVHNFLRRKQRLYETEKEVIKFVSKYTEGKNSYLKKINDRLIALKKDPYEKEMFNFFDFQEWTAGKLNEKIK